MFIYRWWVCRYFGVCLFLKIYVYIFTCMCTCVLSCFSLSLCDPMDYSPPGSSVHGDSLRNNTGVDCHALLQGIFKTQGWNLCLLCLLHWQVGSLPLAPPGKPYMCVCVCVCVCIYIWHIYNFIFRYIYVYTHISEFEEP